MTWPLTSRGSQPLQRRRRSKRYSTQHLIRRSSANRWAQGRRREKVTAGARAAIVSQLGEEQGESGENSEALILNRSKESYPIVAQRASESPDNCALAGTGLLPARSGARASRCDREEWVGALASGLGLKCHLPIFSETRLSLSENSFTTDDLCNLLSGWDIYGCLMFERGAELHRLKSSLQVISLYVVESLYDTIWFCLLPIVHKASQREKEKENGVLTLLKFCWL